MFSVIEAEQSPDDNNNKSGPRHITPAKDKVKKRPRKGDKSYIASVDCHLDGYYEIHPKSKKSCKNDIKLNKGQYQHQRHQPHNSYSSDDIQHEDLSYFSKDKLKIDLDDYPTKDKPLLHRNKKPHVVSDCTRMDTVALEESEENENDNVYAFDNVCNNSNGGISEISCWDEARKAICPEEAKLAPSAALIEQDIISKQRKEIMLLMDELSTRDQELNDLVRSHQSQVKAWEGDRNKLKDLQQKLCSYEKDLQRSDNQLQLTLNEMEKVTSQKEVDGVELKKTKEEMEKLSKKIQQNSFYLKEMEVQNKNLMDSVKKLVSTKEDLETRGKDLSSRLKSKTGEFNLQSSEISKLTSQNTMLESKLLEARETSRNLKAETSAWKNRYCMAKDETDQLTEENKKKDNHIQVLTVQLHETLQQTLALQKALFTSCEREKCKEEIMNSLRKQQQRTSQEMTNLRKLYERQTKDLTLYHLSVQNVSGSNEAGGEEMDGDGRGVRLVSEPFVDKQRHQNGQGEGRKVKRSPEEIEKNASRRGHVGENHKLRGKNNKNMSYNSHKPNFLKYESREENSTFLVKKKIIRPKSLGSEEKDFHDDRNDFINSPRCERREEGEENDTDTSKECDWNLPCRDNGAEVKISIASENTNRRGRENRKTKDSNDLGSRNGNHQRMEMAEKKRRSQSVGCESNYRSLPINPPLCSRATSPLRIQDRGTSPIANFMYTTDDFNQTLDCVRNTLNEVKKMEDDMCKRMNEKNGYTETEETTTEVKENNIADINQAIAEPAVKHGQQHNETSGVYLSSSDCNSSSTLSSPGRERIFDELTPADSDGMCYELQRNFIPDHLKSIRSYLGLERKSNSIHLRNSPTAILPEQQDNTPTTNKREISSQRASDDTYCLPKRNVYVGRMYRLVDEQDNNDENVIKERWSESSNPPTSSMGMSIKSDGTKDETSASTSAQTLHHYNHSGCSYGSNSNSPYFMGRENEDKTKMNLAVLNSIQRDHTFSNRNENKIVNVSLNNTGSSAGNLYTSKYSKPPSNPSSSQYKFYKDERRPIQVEKNDMDSRKLPGAENDILDRRRAVSDSRCVTIASPEQQNFHERKNAFCENWRKASTTHQNTQNSVLSSGSEKSELSLSSTSHKANNGSSFIQSSESNVIDRPKIGHKSHKANNDSSLNRSSESKVIDRLKMRSQSPQPSAEIIPKSVEDNKRSDVELSDVDKNLDEKRTYFYQESFSSDIDCHPFQRSTRHADSKVENNAYIVPVPVSNSSRPFTSTRAPSLYKQLSRIHFSETSNRYEWVSNGSNQESQNDDTQRDKSTVSSFANNKLEDKRGDSVNSFSKGSNLQNNSNSNNNNCNDQLFGNERVDNFEDSSSCLDSIISSQSPNTNMDKFHHHYNNIVKKLSSPNLPTHSEDSNLGSSIISCSNNMLSKPVSVNLRKGNNNVSKRSEYRNTPSDESIFSPSQIHIVVSNSENNSVIDDNIVRQLNFSDSVCMNVIEVETSTPNIPEVNFENRVVVGSSGHEFETMNIPLKCSDLVEDHNFYSRNEKFVRYLSDEDERTKHFNDRDEANKNPKIIKFNPKDKLLWNICNDDVEKIPIVKEECVSKMNEKCKSSQNKDIYPQKISFQNPDEREGEMEFVASLPDYFPDISSVIADEDSLNIDNEEERSGNINMQETFDRKIGLGKSLDEYATSESDCDVTPKFAIPHSHKPYSHTSTPTNARTVSVFHPQNDHRMNSPQNKKVTQMVEEKTLTLSGTGCCGAECSYVNEVNTGYDNSEDSSVMGDGGDEIKTDNHTNVLNVEKEKKCTRLIVDDGNILQSMQEKDDMLKKEIYSVYDVKHQHSSDKSSYKLKRDQKEFGKLCSSQDEVEKHPIISHDHCSNDQSSITKEVSKSPESQLKPVVRCNGDGKCQKDDSSFLEGPHDAFDNQLSIFLSDSTRDESEDLSVTIPVPMSPASKLHHLLVESQAMILSLEKISPLQ